MKTRLEPLKATPGKATRSGKTDPTANRKTRQNSTYMTVREAAAYLNCSKSLLDKARVAGSGPRFIRVGMKKILYARCELDRWMHARTFASTAEYDGYDE